MKTTIIALSAAALIASTPAVFAQGTTPSQTPGHQMQKEGATGGTPGASGYTPGHQMRENGKEGTKGASGYAPGQTTGSSTSDRDSTRMKK